MAVSLANTKVVAEQVFKPSERDGGGATYQQCHIRLGSLINLCHLYPGKGLSVKTTIRVRLMVCSPNMARVRLELTRCTHGHHHQTRLELRTGRESEIIPVLVWHNRMQNQVRAKCKRCGAIIVPPHDASGVGYTSPCPGVCEET